MKRLGASTLLLVAVVVTGLAYADTALTGRTTATVKLIADIRKGIDLLALIRLSCSHLDSIAAAPMPGDFDPKDLPQVPATLLPPPKGPIGYELWTAVGCGRSVPIVVRLWRTNTGKQTFGLTPLTKRDAGS